MPARNRRDGFSLLAKVLDSRSREHGDTPSDLDFGTIKSDYSLKCDNFPEMIAPGDYTICRSTKADEGSRVLLVWVGDEPVVIDIIESPKNHNWGGD